MKDSYEGNILEVVECIKDDIINELYMIRLDNKDFDTDGVEKIKAKIDNYLDIINGIYQDLITEYYGFQDIIRLFYNKNGILEYRKIGVE